MEEKIIIETIPALPAIQSIKQSFVFNYFLITIISVIAFYFILFLLDTVNTKWFRSAKEKFDEAKKADDDYNKEHPRANTTENVDNLKETAYLIFKSDEYLDFKDRFVDECGDFLPFLRRKLYYRVLLHRISGLGLICATGYAVFLIINNRIIEAKTIFTILITLGIFYVFMKGVDKGYKDDNCIVQNGWKTESIFKILDNKSWKGKNKYQVGEKFLEKIKTESIERHKESYDFLKWWLPQIIAWLGSIYFIWFGGKW